MLANNQLQFSLEQEAQNTELCQSRNFDLKLRHAKVAFVSTEQPTRDELVIALPERQKANVEPTYSPLASAGVLDGALLAQLKLQNSDCQKISSETLCETSGGDCRPVIEQNHVTICMREMEASSKILVNGVRGAHEFIHPGLSQSVTRRSQSPELSDSSEEIIVFPGRARVRGDLRSDHHFRQEVDGISQQCKDSLGRRAISIVNSMAPNSESLLHLKDYVPTRPPEKIFLRSDLLTLETHTNSRQILESIYQTKSQVDASTADCVTHRDTSQIFIEPSPEHDIGVNDQIEGLLSEAIHSEVPRHSDLGWGFSKLQDLHDFDTSSEDLFSLIRVSPMPERRLNDQYVSVEEEHSVDSAPRRSRKFSEMTGIQPNVQTQESEQFKSYEYSTDSDDLNGDVLARQRAMDVQQDLDDLLKDQDLPSQKGRMTDEKIARLLSKHEELGLGFSDLLLFDGQEDEEEDQPELSQQVKRSNTLRYENITKSLSFKNFSASPFSNVNNINSYDRLKLHDGFDLYNGFDVMDHGRPSLRQRPKRRHGINPLNLTDTDMFDTDVNNSVRLAWKKDRAKKKIRKQEREELRAQGHLGKKNKPDLKAKYIEGMSMVAFKNEVRSFLLSAAERSVIYSGLLSVSIDYDSIELPPMDHGDRKTVHEIANVLKLKSRSVGGGKSRFPVLYKTSRTASYDGDALIALEAWMSGGRFLPRRDNGPGKGHVAMRRSRGGGFSKANVSYQDGEVVGAAAPELGQENKGRAMLERMGWSTGTALGATNNKGIMQPVAHVVKNTKAGLG